ncbi:MAG: TlpA family protein disulfide reductase [Cyclobacteriaceae bacterium]|nr:TlpA family protein disulfide reductase [Cyclobacteriaceae bacterium]
MKSKSIYFLIFLLIFTIEMFAQTSPLFRMKNSKKYITKAQVDSIAKANDNKVTYNFTKEDGVQVVEVELMKGNDAAAAGNQTFTRTSSAPRTGDSTGTAMTKPLIRQKSYKDEAGKDMPPAEFKEKVKSGKYASRYSIDNMSPEGSDVTYYLVPKEEAERNQATSHQEAKDNLLNVRLPEFKLVTAAGKEFKSSSLAGKIVVLNFWFTGCVPCRIEMPSLNKVVEHYKDRNDVVFLAPALDKPDALTRFLEKHAFNYQILAESKELNDQLKLGIYPTHLIVDKSGIIRSVHIGATEEIDKSLIASINKVSEAKP